MPRFTVQHFVLASVVVRRPAQRAVDVLGVAYNLTVASDVEFPKRIGPVELFVRFVPRAVKPIRPVVTVTHLDAPGGPRRVYRRQFDVTRGQPPPQPVFDASLKVVHLELSGLGLYAVRLFGPRPAAWAKRPLLATDYFRVQRAT